MRLRRLRGSVATVAKIAWSVAKVTWSVAMVAKEHGLLRRLRQFQKWHWLVARMALSVATIKRFVSNGCGRVSFWRLWRHGIEMRCCNNSTDFAQKSVFKKKSSHRSLTFIRECSWFYELIPTRSSTSSVIEVGMNSQLVTADVQLWKVER
jgi:hypothetical protein